MADPLIAQADLEARWPPHVIAEIWCDDGSGVAGPRLATSIQVGSRYAESILLRGWGADAIADMVEADEAVKQMVCELVVGHGVSHRPHLSGPGAPYEGMWAKAEKFLKELAAAERRSIGEQGSHPVTRARINRPELPQFLFTPSSSGSSKLGGF